VIQNQNKEILELTKVVGDLRLQNEDVKLEMMNLAKIQKEKSNLSKLEKDKAEDKIR